MEREFIDWLRQELAGRGMSAASLGDDAAVLGWPAKTDCVVTTDLLADGVHFELQACGAELAGRKALAVNLSDLAAMGATPLAAFSSLLLPRDSASAIARQVSTGMLRLADEFKVNLAGGDTNVWNGPLVINVSALGSVAPGTAWTRAGVCPGDLLMVTGPLGGSILGHHLTFTPRVREALYLRSHYQIHAAMDLSDGLALDAWRMARESGCGMVLDAQAIPISEAAGRMADASSSSKVLDHALSDGEDFELLVATAPSTAAAIGNDAPRAPNCHVIGRAIPEPGVWLEQPDGTRRVLPPRGYEHGS